MHELESRTGSRVLWSWEIAGSSGKLLDNRKHFEKEDGVFCYQLIMRSNASHLLCGENDPSRETEFLYAMSGLDRAIVKERCGS